METSNWIAIAAVGVAAASWLDARRHTNKQLQAQNSAALYAERGDIRWEPVEYEFLIGNSGPADAWSIGIMLRAGDTHVGTDGGVDPLRAGETRNLNMTMGRPLSHTEGNRTPARLVATWTDGAGTHEKELLSDLPSGP